MKGFSQQQANKLRTKARSYLSAKNYEDASRCYSAVLQILEGVGGYESGELRRRCGLTLAECEIKLGNLEHAIARCSDVIAETPELISRDGEHLTGNNSMENLSFEDYNRNIQQTIGKALYRRAIAFKRFEKPLLSLIDLKESLKYLPNDSKILLEISSIEGNTFIMEDKRNFPDSYYENELNEIVEDVQINCPRNYMTLKEIEILLSISRPSSSSLSSSSELSSPFSMFDKAMTDNSFNLNEMMSKLMPNDGIGNMNPFQNMDMSNVLSMLPMFGPMMGMDTGLINQITDIWKAISKTFSTFKNFYMKLKLHSNFIVMMLGFGWVIYAICAPLTTYLLRTFKL